MSETEAEKERGIEGRKETEREREGRREREREGYLRGPCCAKERMKVTSDPA